jgi:hypothetical protein
LEQIAYAVTVQLWPLPVSSSTPLTQTWVSVELASSPSSSTWPLALVVSPPTPSRRLLVGQTARAFLFDELDALVTAIRSRPAGGAAQIA